MFILPFGLNVSVLSLAHVQSSCWHKVMKMIACSSNTIFDINLVIIYAVPSNQSADLLLLILFQHFPASIHFRRLLVYE